MTEGSTQGGVVRDAAAADVVLEVTSNGTRERAIPFNPDNLQGGRPATVAEVKAAVAAGGRVSRFDPSDPEQFARLLAGVAENVDMHREAAALRGEEFDTSLMAKVKRVSNTRIRVGHVGVVIAVGTAAYILWEGLAYYFDWPRTGLFGDGNKIAEKPMRRAA